MYLNCQNASFYIDPLSVNDSKMPASEMDKTFSQEKMKYLKQTLKGTIMQLHSHKKGSLKMKKAMLFSYLETLMQK